MEVPKLVMKVLIIKNPQLIVNNINNTSCKDLLMASFTTEQECSELKNRRVKHFGFEFNYSSNDIDADKPIQEGKHRLFRKKM